MAKKLDLKTRLTLELATLFDDEDNARMISTHAALTLIDIEFGGSAAEIWTNVVRQATLQKRVEELIACAREHYADDEILREADAALKADPHVFDAAPLEESESKSRAPQQIFITVGMLIVVILIVALIPMPNWARVAIVTVTYPLFLPLLRRMLPSIGITTPAPSSTTLAEIDSDSGLAGGFAGGIVTGLLLSVVYTKANPTIPLIKLLPVVTLFFGFAVALLGWFVAAITSWFVRLSGGKATWLFNEITACLVAGTVAGLVSGPGIAWQFGKHEGDWAFAGPNVLLTGILPGCVVVGVFIAIWEQWPLPRHLFRSIAASTITAWIIGLGAIAISDALNLRDVFYHLLYDSRTPGGRLQGGLIYGLAIGVISGLVIGISIFLSRHWPEHTGTAGHA